MTPESIFAFMLCVPLAGAVIALAAGRHRMFAIISGSVTGWLACLSGLVLTIKVLYYGSGVSCTIEHCVPGGAFTLEADHLSAYFIGVTSLIGILCFLYAVDYLGHTAPEKRINGVVAALNILIAGIFLALCTQNALLFLFAWELTAISSFIPVMFDDDLSETRKAGRVYLIACQFGTIFLFFFFLKLSSIAGSCEFSSMTGLDISPALKNLLLIASLIGFGTKAGFIPLHVWLPEAHPAAPSHISAIMSGVMIKTGIYGILRAVLILDYAPGWFGQALLAIGAASGILGVLYALAQHDLKRLLAYHSVENMGIIALGLGMGFWGAASDMPIVAALGLSGALFHVLNHALFKSLLFLGAGAVYHATGTREMDRLGGLYKKMPGTALPFLAGSVAIAGLPPLNGFMSEFLIFLSALYALTAENNSDFATPCAAILALALIGGLASACFAKVFGVVFLGEPRTETALTPERIGFPMKSAMCISALICCLVCLIMPFQLTLLNPIIEKFPGMFGELSISGLNIGKSFLMPVLYSFLVFGAALGLFIILRRLFLQGKTIEKGPIWDCGYAIPEARMQYTASSFADFLLKVFAVLLPTETHNPDVSGCFPGKRAFHSHTPDFFMHVCFRKILRFHSGVCTVLHRLQQKPMQIYILYISLTLVALLLWNL